jgi:hypothetical protein
MNTLTRRFFLGLGFCLALYTSTGFSQAPAEEKIEDEYVKIKKAEIAQQKAPDFSLKGATTDKKFKAKDWLELEFELEIKAPKNAKSNQHFLDELQLKYYVYLEPADATKKKTLTAEVNYINAPIGETTHSVVYLSNATLVNLTGDKVVSKGHVKYYGVEVYSGGKLVGRHSSTAGVWWTSPKAPPVEAGRLQQKSKTPFAPLWFDYYLEEKGL